MKGRREENRINVLTETDCKINLKNIAIVLATIIGQLKKKPTPFFCSIQTDNGFTRPVQSSATINRQTRSPSPSATSFLYSELICRIQIFFFDYFTVRLDLLGYLPCSSM